MPDTIRTTFDPTVLPAWAQRLPVVVNRAAYHFGYRCDVILRGDDVVWRMLLIEEAYRAHWVAEER